ncbi:hypothetical protein SteCoe_7592 [Stentor coeruleus]|uniref:Palmitoyltransferase n=1 Tax=Stentor coeruleus TaxID=5963 RepID=A0A1R2CM61_9CILI|nr:hypothetical protein SteCoe_7592 [Stentor coeruleus]
MDRPARKNGFSRPFHPYQITSWFIQFFNIIGFFFTTIPCLNSNMRISIGIIYSIFQISTIYFGYKLASSIPTDEIVIIFLTSTDKELIKKLEENPDKYCSFCKSPVKRTSKHCSRCNRCTNNFDHHCKWVNNCIGETNYKTFVILISVCMFLELIICVVCGNNFVESFVSNEVVRRQIEDYYSKDVFVLFQVIQAVMMLEGILFTFLLGYLVGLHLYLRFKGMTTYEYILSKRADTKIIYKEKRFDTTTLNNNSYLNNHIKETQAHCHDLRKSNQRLKTSSRI